MQCNDQHALLFQQLRQLVRNGKGPYLQGDGHIQRKECMSQSAYKHRRVIKVVGDILQGEKKHPLR